MRVIDIGVMFIFLTFLLVGCAELEQYILEGESDHWRAKLEVTVMEERITQDFVVTFKGDVEQLADTRRLEYSYKTAASSSKSEINFSEEPPQEKSFSHYGGSSRSSFDSDQSVKVTIKWDENEEKMVIN
ncbi:hypothetical protein [Thalassobacillus sp. CUG 92003]|uniref:hypothetical protein n=1 Tax=Thalassobacillus sp. CUG 92003 TaxID=2736641 RepID=UPI0015E70EA9|nr:hypothetical protein [Thalassobacillus sp. CUG 92003]